MLAIMYHLTVHTMLGERIGLIGLDEPTVGLDEFCTYVGDAARLCFRSYHQLISCQILDDFKLSTATGVETRDSPAYLWGGRIDILEITPTDRPRQPGPRLDRLSRRPAFFVNSGTAVIVPGWPGGAMHTVVFGAGPADLYIVPPTPPRGAEVIGVTASISGAVAAVCYSVDDHGYLLAVVSLITSGREAVIWSIDLNTRPTSVDLIEVGGSNGTIMLLVIGDERGRLYSHRLEHHIGWLGRSEILSPPVRLVPKGRTLTIG